MDIKNNYFLGLVLLASNCVFAQEQKTEDKKTAKTVVPFNKISPAHFFDNDTEFKFNLTNRSEAFFGEWTTYLNHSVPQDQMLFARHTLDAKVTIGYGQNRYGCKVVEMGAGMRNRAIWGTPDSIAQTTRNEIPSMGANFGAHFHYLHKHFIWMREAWLKFSLDHAFRCMDDSQPQVDHFIRLGYFSYQLGRGISLGDAFAVNSAFLGFYGKSSIVDQFAPGLQISGKCIKGRCNYDFYLSTVDNKDTDLDKTGQKIYTQMYERRNQTNGEIRGAFHIATILAARLKCKVIDQPKDKGNAELYGLWFYDPEQMVELPADTRSNLYTIGAAGEFNLGKIEFGFDCAKNFGSQFVLGIDRNKKSLEENKDSIGAVTLTNSHVVLNNASGTKVLGAPYDVKTSKDRSVQRLVTDCDTGEYYNGKQLGFEDETMVTVVGGTPYNIYNASDRFRNSYTNKFNGAMFVTDVSYWVVPKDFYIATAFGYASGGDNPHTRHNDETFTGFIPVQSAYAGGDKVRSYFVLGGGGKLKRILSYKRKNSVAATVSGFTDLMYIGIGSKWAPVKCNKKWYIHPNALIYWKTHHIAEYVDCNTNVASDERTNSCTEQERLASNFLGSELNLFLGYHTFESLEFFFAGSFFIPGNHYTERKGDLAGDYPLGDDPAFALNFGFNYRF
ncbi:MAG: hypothetical protein UR26_C0001G0053 [candidate division TM6 bacterium GW2011_GWF2_32_72]|nr:MAG: hypothetical protein UR26_C0001G0053 [candidate division TM6 bacterium GW2011_GWF2_32_72]